MILFDQAIDILKRRWQEVVLLVVLQAGMGLLCEQIMRVSELSESQNAPLPGWAGFLLGLGFIGFSVIWQMMYLGFLKTAATEGPQPRQPMELLQSGRRYFFRVLVLQILIGLVVMFISYMIAMGFGFLLRRSDLPEWLTQVCSVAAMFIMLKPMLFITARILVYDQNALEGAFYVRTYTLSAIEGLLNFIYSAFSSLLILTVFMSFIPEKSMWSTVYSGLFNVVLSLLMLVPTLTVVLFMQAVYDEANEQKEREDID